MSWACTDLPINKDGTYAPCNDWRAYDLDLMSSQFDYMATRVGRIDAGLTALQSSVQSSSGQSGTSTNYDDRITSLENKISMYSSLDARISALETNSSTATSATNGWLPAITQSESNELTAAFLMLIAIAFIFRIVKKQIF